MEPIYQLLETASKNPSLLIQNSIQPFHGPTLPLDPVNELLFKHSSSNNAATETLLI